MRKRLRTFVFLGLASIASPVLASDYDFTTLDVPGAAVTQPRAINDRGTIVGTWGTGDASLHAAAPIHGFVYDHGTFTTIDAPDTSWTYPEGIDESGRIVGYYGPYDQSGFALGPIHGFTLDDGGFATLDFTGYSISFVNAISARDEIVGFGVDGANHARGIIVEKGVQTELVQPGQESVYPVDVTSSGQILIESWVYDRGSFDLVSVPGSPLTLAQGMNNAGDVVGTYQDGGVKGFLRWHDSYEEISFPGAFTTAPLAINDNGDIVGTYSMSPDELPHGFIARRRGVAGISLP